MAERQKKSSSNFRRLTGFIRPYRPYFVLALFLTLLLAVLNPARPYLMQYILDHPVIEGDVAAVRRWVFIIIAMLLGQTVLMYYQIVLTNYLGQTVINDLRHKVFAHIVGLRMRYFDQTPVGALQTRAVSDVQTLINVFSEGLVTISGEILQLVTILGLMFYTDWRLTLVTLSVIPFLLIGITIFRKKVGVAFQDVRKYVSELNTFLQEHITGLPVVQLFNRQDKEFKRFNELNERHTRAHLDTVYYYSIFFPAVEFIAAAGTALLVWYGARSILAEELTFGALVAFLMYIQMFFRPIRMLADQFNSLQMGLVSAERIFKVLDTDERTPETPDGLPGARITHTNASVSFKNVVFGYNENEPVLRNVSFDVPSGTTAAFVGATGAGKSSLINVLMRFYEIQSGTVEVAGEDARKYKLYEFRAAMGLVLQDVFLFSGSVYENITLGAPHITREQVRAAAALIEADRFIERLPGGYEYKVGERGATLSAGQRQLISFLRVLVHDPKILLLDEATANIDSETEYVVQQAIAKVMAGRTALIIAHRLSTIQKADCIYVMRRGEIVERGTHYSLLEEKGYYYKLHQVQYATQLV